MKRTVIVSAKRSPIGRFLGSLVRLPAPEVGAQVAKVVLDETKAVSAGIDEVIVGNVLQGGVGQNPARQVALKAGLPPTITAWTVNKVCGSGLEAVAQGDRAIRAEDAKVVLAGGIESMTLAPHFIRNVRTGHKFGDGKLIDGMMYDGLTCAFENWPMGCAADATAKEKGITREDQDLFAMQSHQRATAAHKAGHFDKETVTIDIGRGKTFAKDETYREDSNMESLAKLPPAFGKEGTVSAGNASQISDGAALLLIAEADTAKANGWPIRAEIISYATAGAAPKDLFLTPIDAVKMAVEKAGMSLGDVDLFELNEAFAAQSIACLRGLELSADKVNRWGGAIALGHPIGASGARILVTLLHAMEQRDVRTGVASACLGGGNAVAMVVRRP